MESMLEEYNLPQTERYQNRQNRSNSEKKGNCIKAIEGLSDKLPRENDDTVEAAE